MENPKGSVRVAVTQHEPVWLDLQATVTKTCTVIEEAAKAGAKLVAFPGMPSTDRMAEGNF